MKEEVINQLIEYMEQSKDFILQEAPDIIREMFLYEKISAWCGFIFCVFCFFSCISVFIYSWYYPSLDNYGCLKTETFMPRLFSTVLSFLAFIGLISNLDTLIKIYFAPKYFIIKIILGWKQ
jgi:hypothetical protein